MSLKDITTAKIPISCIMAVDSNFGISKDCKIPWNIPEVREHFSKVTKYITHTGTKNVVVMGKNTWEDLPEKFKPLADRVNVVISSTLFEQQKNNADQNVDGQYTFFCKDLNDAYAKIFKFHCDRFPVKEIFIIGGKQLYETFLNTNLAENVYITKIKHDYETDNIVKFNEYHYHKQTVVPLKANDVNAFTYKRVKNLEELLYIKALKRILETNVLRPTRNSNTYSVFHECLKFDLSKYFPLLTTKKMFMRGIFEELKFFLIGDTNTKHLEEKKVNIWKGNTSREFLDSVGLNHLQEGDMGPLYGFQLRHYGSTYNGCSEDYTGVGFDQFANVLNLLKNDRHSRRILMTMFNPAQICNGPLPPCHGIVIQFYVDGDNKLSCSMYQRSADFFHGVPFNVASYALLVHIICELVNNDTTHSNPKLIPGTLIMTFGDCHVYEAHKDVVEQQLDRTPFVFPQLKITKEITDVSQLEFSDVSITDYKCHGSLKADMVA